MDLSIPLTNETIYTSNKRICDIKPFDKNLDMQVILINLVSKNKLKNDTKITQFLVGDATGSILCNFFDETGDRLNEGDIIFLKCCYGSVFKNKLILYTGKPGFGKVIKLGEFFMNFSETPDLSAVEWRKDRDPRTGMEVFVQVADSQDVEMNY
jgi:hypothetical protein